MSLFHKTHSFTRYFLKLGSLIGKSISNEFPISKKNSTCNRLMRKRVDNPDIERSTPVKKKLFNGYCLRMISFSLYIFLPFSSIFCKHSVCNAICIRLRLSSTMEQRLCCSARWETDNCLIRIGEAALRDLDFCALLALLSCPDWQRSEYLGVWKVWVYTQYKIKIEKHFFAKVKKIFSQGGEWMAGENAPGNYARVFSASCAPWFHFLHYYLI